MTTHLLWGATVLLALISPVSYAFSCADTATTGVPQIECEALVALYESTDGDNWRDNTHWKTATPLSSWYGIKEVSGGHVTSLSFSDNNLKGSLPSELSQLTQLQRLYLDSNQLTGTIPSELGQLANLMLLALSGNQLTGRLPSTLGQLAQLQKLYASNNQLTGTIPTELGQLTQLRSLYIYNNQFTGTIPSELGQLTQLSHLSLGGNQLIGTIPTELAQLTHLKTLFLENNYLTGNTPAPELADVLRNLVYLNIENNCLNPTDPAIHTILNDKNFLWLPNWRTTQTHCSPPCQLYAVHDDKRNDSQFFTVNLEDLSITELGDLYSGYDIEALAMHPQTNTLYAAAGDNATTGQAGYLYEVNSATGQLTAIGDTQFAEIEDLAFSPDGTLYAWAKGQGLITVDVESGQGTLLLASTIALEGLTLSKQADTTIFYGTANGELWQYDLSADTLAVLCTDLQSEIEALEMLNTGELLIGSHATPFGMHLLNPETCQLTLATDNLANQFNDVEGLAIPVAACQ